MRGINFDHLACAPVLPEVREAMMPFLSGEMGNPLSRHLFGDRPREALESARGQVAELINAQPEEIIFTSCGSESNNLAIKGVGAGYANKGKHIIATPIERHSILHPLKSLEKQGYEISWLKVDQHGKIEPEEISSLVRKDTILVTVTSASNEIGTLEPIKEIGNRIHQKGILFHTDAIASAGFVGLDVNELNVDLLSLAGNAFYGPLGTGALYVRKGIRVIPLIEGGVQENGLRAGTHNLAGIVGMGIAAKLAKEKLSQRKDTLIQLREKLITGLLESVPDSFVTGERTNRLPGHASFCIKFIEGESILLHLSLTAGIAGTSGSTCSSEALKTSHVLDAMGIDPIWAQGSVVFSLGIENTPEEVELFLKQLPPVVDRLRKMSPLTLANNVDQFRYRRP